MVVQVALPTPLDHHITPRVGLGNGTVEVEGAATGKAILVVHRQRPKGIDPVGNIFKRQRLRLR